MLSNLVAHPTLLSPVFSKSRDLTARPEVTTPTLQPMLLEPMPPPPPLFHPPWPATHPAAVELPDPLDLDLDLEALPTPRTLAKRLVITVPLLWSQMLPRSTLPVLWPLPPELLPSSCSKERQSHSSFFPFTPPATWQSFINVFLSYVSISQSLFS